MGAFNIPLQVNHPQFDTPLDAQKQVLGLKQLAGVVAGQAQDRQLNERRMQESALRIKDEEAKQLEEQAARDEAAESDRIHREAKFDPDKVVELAKASPKIRAPKVMELQQKALDIKKSVQALSDADVAKQIANHEVFGEDIDAIRHAPAEKRQGMLAAAIARNLVEKRITPEEARQHSQIDVKNDALLEHLELGLRSSSAMLESDKKRRDSEAAASAKVRENRDKDRLEFGEKLSTAIAGGSVSDQRSLDEFLAEEKKSYPSLSAEIGRITKFDPKITPEVAGRMARTVAQQDALAKGLQDKTLSEQELALAAAKGDKDAEKALKLLAEQKRAGAGGESASQARLRENDLQGRIDREQTKVDNLQISKDKLSAENEGLGEEITRIQTQLKDDASITPAERSRLIAKDGELRGKIKKNTQEFNGLHDQQAKSQERKEGLLGKNKPSNDNDPVQVMDANGNIGTVPRKNLAEAKKRGAKEVTPKP